MRGDCAIAQPVRERPLAPALRHSVLAAGWIHLAWGVAAAAAPSAPFELAHMAGPAHPLLWRLLAGVLALCGTLLISAWRDPLRYWNHVLFGLVVNLTSPLCIWIAATDESLPLSGAVMMFLSHAVWWVPFTLVLIRAYRNHIYSDAPPLGIVPEFGSMRESAADEDVFTSLRTQHGDTLRDLSRDQNVMAVLLRHAGCTFCREALADIAGQREVIEATGTLLVLVHMSSDRSAAKILQQHGLGTLPRISDPERRLYRSLGLRRGRLGQLFGPKVWLRALVAGLLAGHGAGLLDGDGFQMPGVFLILDGRIIYRYRHRLASDRPDYAAIARWPLRGGSGPIAAL